MNTETRMASSSKLAEVKLTYSAHPEQQDYPVLDSPDDVYGYLCDIWDTGKIELQEEFIVILLNNALRVLGWQKISRGSKSATIVDIPIVATTALLANASSIIIAHNHPSGLLHPSTQDRNLTFRIKKALSYLNIQLEDHLIITKSGYYSFKSKGLL